MTLKVDSVALRTIFFRRGNELETNREWGTLYYSERIIRKLANMDTSLQPSPLTHHTVTDSLRHPDRLLLSSQTGRKQ